MTNENQALRPGVDLKRLKFIFLWVFAFGLVAHGFCYFNGNFSHDSLRSIYEPGPYAMIAAGRYCRAIYRLIRGNFTLPVINTISQLNSLIIQSLPVILEMTREDSEQMVSHKRSTTFSRVAKTSFRKPRLRISFQICSMGFISGVYGGI